MHSVPNSACSKRLARSVEANKTLLSVLSITRANGTGRFPIITQYFHRLVTDINNTADSGNKSG